MFDEPGCRASADNHLASNLERGIELADARRRSRLLAVELVVGCFCSGGVQRLRVSTGAPFASHQDRSVGDGALERVARSEIADGIAGIVTHAGGVGTDSEAIVLVPGVKVVGESFDVPFIPLYAHEGR